MESSTKTRAGYRMNDKVRAKIVAQMIERNDEPMRVIAARVGISTRTLSDYLTADVKAEIERLRLTGPVEVSIEEIDRAMMRQATRGNVQAAKLVYLRMAQKGEVGPLPTLDELEAELKKLKQLERTENGTRDDDSSAMADGKGRRAGGLPAKA